MILVWDKFPEGLILADSPEGLAKTALLRATNARLDASGTLMVRAGRTVAEGPFPAPVRSLFSVLVDGTPRRYAVAGQTLYRDGVSVLEHLSSDRPDMWFVAFGPMGEST